MSNENKIAIRRDYSSDAYYEFSNEDSYEDNQCIRSSDLYQNEFLTRIIFRLAFNQISFQFFTDRDVARDPDFNGLTKDIGIIGLDESDTDKVPADPSRILLDKYQSVLSSLPSNATYISSAFPGVTGTNYTKSELASISNNKCLYNIVVTDNYSYIGSESQLLLDRGNRVFASEKIGMTYTPSQYRNYCMIYAVGAPDDYIMIPSMDSINNPTNLTNKFTRNIYWYISSKDTAQYPVIAKLNVLPISDLFSYEADYATGTVTNISLKYGMTKELSINYQPVIEKDPYNLTNNYIYDIVIDPLPIVIL